jgi:hypothetical protein
MTRSEILDELCSQCRHLKKNVDTEEFWGFMADRVTYECDLLRHDAEDPDCPEHERWLRIAEAGDETGEYRLEDGDE